MWFKKKKFKNKQAKIYSKNKYINFIIEYFFDLPKVLRGGLYVVLFLYIFKFSYYFYNLNELHEVFPRFILNLNNYKPREYILENLSIEKCNEKFIQLVNKI